MALKGKELVEKSNTLNQFRQNGMTIQELRFFSIYLSKINARDESTRVVRFPLSDFQKIMNFGRLNISQIRNATNRLLCKVVEIPLKKGYTSFQIFKKCTVSQDEFGEWYIEINANDDALPLMFDLKKHYFKYELWNVLKLKSPNQLRMYELLKQYQHIGKLEISVNMLRELLGIDKKEYPRLERFKKKVLDSCQLALTENTDITYTYERGKTGSHGKWLTIIFHIEKNPNYVDKLMLKDFINEQDLENEPNEDFSLLTNHLKLLSEACNSEFSDNDIIHISDKLNAFVNEKAQISYLHSKYSDMVYRDNELKKKNDKIKNRFAYVKKLIENDYKEYLTEQAEKELEHTTHTVKQRTSNDAAYDISEYEKTSIADLSDEEWAKILRGES